MKEFAQAKKIKVVLVSEEAFVPYEGDINFLATEDRLAVVFDGKMTVFMLHDVSRFEVTTK